MLSLLTYDLDDSRKLSLSKTKNRLVQVNGTPDSFFGCKFDSDRNEVVFNNVDVGNHSIRLENTGSNLVTVGRLFQQINQQTESFILGNSYFVASKKSI